RFIIADDHPLFRVALRQAIEQLVPNCSILEAESLPRLLALVDAHDDIDLVLLDLLMPDANGFSALINLRAQYPHIPVAIVSAMEELSAVKRSLEFGASGFIPKSASAE